jgi:hypothetical protein
MVFPDMNTQKYEALQGLHIVGLSMRESEKFLMSYNEASDGAIWCRSNIIG